jgi:hypothetical protein
MTPSSEALIQAEVTVKVVDEEGESINDADVEIVFSEARAKPLGKGWGNIVDYNKVNGKTNPDGIFSASGTTNMNIPVLASKAGFYNSSGGISFNESGKADKEIVKLVLKKKRNPVPMYAKNTDWIKIPVFNEPVGYDLEVGDWVSPHGSGKVNDFIFTFHVEPHEISYVLSFSDKNDGIQEYMHKQDQSSYRWPFEAPVAGYQNSLVRDLKYVDRKMITTLKKDVKYIYRIRTVVDKQGQIIKACYGKIPSEIDIATDGYVKFSYYFNPDDSSRSLEFNTDKNLFIPEGAEVYRPEYDNFIRSEF